MMTGEVIFGGVGSGLYGMLLFVLLAVFIAGLMVGRTPEYLGKKIEAREIKLVVIGTLVVPMLRARSPPRWRSRPSGARPRSSTPGPQGFSETLYAYTSQTNNNGSAFAGYTGFVQPNAPGNAGAFGITFADLLGGLAMLLGRFVPLLAALAVAGSLVGKRIAPAGPGTLRTDTPTFVGAAHRRRHHRRRAHLPPRARARPGRPGPQRPALLTMPAQGPDRRPSSPSSSCTVVLGLVYPLLMTGVAQVAVPEQGRRQPGRAQREGRRLAL